MKLADLVEHYLGTPGGIGDQVGTDSVEDLSASLRAQPPTVPQVDLPSSVEDWPPEWREVYEERAGIMEYEGNLTRADAERNAETDIRVLFRARTSVLTLQ